MKEKIAIRFTGKISPEKPVNEQFTLCKCYVMALGKNQNKTIISKEASDEAIPSLFNIPVVGHLMVDENGSYHMGGHDVVLEKNKDGNYNFKSLTVPFGVVPSQGNVHYEDVEESDGNTKTYLVADVVLWTGKFPQLMDAIYSKDIYFAQSMEIVPYKTAKEDDYLKVESYQYTALCLLGKSDNNKHNIEPCFEQARVEPYEFSKKTWNELFAEFKNELGKYYARTCDEKGGKELKNEYEKENDLYVPAGNDTEPVAEECKVVATNGDCGKNVVESNPAIADEYSADGSKIDKNHGMTLVKRFEIGEKLTYREKLELLTKGLDNQCIWNEDEYIYYRLIDFNDSYVYCEYVHLSESLKLEDKVRIPYTISDTNELLLDISAVESVRLCWLTKDDEAKLNAEKEEFSKLVEYKKQRIEDDRKKEYAMVLDDFSDLNEVDDFKEIAKDVMNFESAEALREKLYAIRGKYAKSAVKKTLQQMRIPVGFAQKASNDVEEFMNKYLPK